MATPEPIPSDPVVSVGKTFAESVWSVTDKWYDWLLNLATILSQCARRLGSPVLLTGQLASIGATSLLAGNPGGRFAVAVTVYVEQAATTSSSITVTISFTRNGLARSLTTTAIVNGTLSSSWSQVFMVDNDSAVPVTYATTYASVGATPMKYGLTLVTESKS